MPEVPEELFLDPDDGLTLSRESGDSVLASYGMATSASPVVLARLWASGPVVAATQLNVFHLIDADETLDVKYANVLPDGTRVVEVSFFIDGKIPKDLSVWLNFYVTDAVFENGDTRYELTAADFDENGVARLRMFKAPGEGVPYICHWISPYKDDTKPGGTSR